MKKHLLAAFAATVSCASFVPSAGAQQSYTVPVTMVTCGSCSGLNNSVTAYNYALDYTFAHPGTENTNLEIDGGDGTSAMFWVDGTGRPEAESSMQSLPISDPTSGSTGGGDGGGGGGGITWNPACQGGGPCSDPITTMPD